jgi:hypothetical protein
MLDAHFQFAGMSVMPEPDSPVLSQWLEELGVRAGVNNLYETPVVQNGT